MSHALAYVVTELNPNMSMLEDILLPWHEYESTGYDEYTEEIDMTDEVFAIWNSMTTEEKDEYENELRFYDKTNPNSKWDWWVPGGRFSGALHDKNDVLFCSWGFYDRHQLEKDCERYKINSNFISNHISLKHQFHNVDKKHTISTKGMGMTKALRILNIPLDGIHHRGIDDAKNIAKIFIKFYDDWKY